ncbi:MAG: glycosyltransferase, partial [Candidatus Gallimonas sp.]
EIVVFHYPNPFAAHYLLKLLDAYPDCKLVLWWHLDITKQKILKKLFSGQTERLLKRAVKVVATSPNYIEGSAQLQSVREKTVVIPNCFNESRVAQTEQTRRAAEEIRARYAGKTICFAVGRHIPYKGMEYLIRASKFLDEKYEVLIGGQGELTERLKALASDDGKVRFLGRLSDEDLKAYLLACDIFCFPSITKNEAFGIALAEAMALGKPSVTFTIEGSGVNYVSLNGETGLEVRNGDAEAYAEAIGKLAADGALRARLGAAAEDRARSLFSLDKFCENVKKLTEGLKDA